jgi:hypothetical protein
MATSGWRLQNSVQDFFLQLYFVLPYGVRNNLVVKPSHSALSDWCMVLSLCSCLLNVCQMEPVVRYCCEQNDCSVMIGFLYIAPLAWECPVICPECTFICWVQIASLVIVCWPKAGAWPDAPIVSCSHSLMFSCSSCSSHLLIVLSLLVTWLEGLYFLEEVGQINET